MVLTRLLLGCVLCVVVSSNVGATYSVYQTIEEITADGFPSETHHVTTSDGYILEMHRIPYGTLVNDTSDDRPVVFVMHGFLSSSQGFVQLGPEYSFAYVLADAGFDVWMGNARGNKNSRFHVSLDPDDNLQKFEFFDFSFEEIGMYDLPAMIDYVLEYTTRDRLHYIGHSQGGTVFLVMASMLPEYNQKLISAHLCAGIGYQEYCPNIELKQQANMTDLLYSTAVLMGAVELFPPNSTEMLPTDVFLLADYCFGNVEMRYMCELVGVRHFLKNYKGAIGQPGAADDQPGAATDQPGAATDQPGAALKQMAHFGQNIRDKLFRRFDYGAVGNLIKYGTTEPPLYDLSLITTFVTMHYSLGDEILDKRDVLAMVADIPKARARQVARTDFKHEDYIAALDAKELVIDYIVKAIQNTGQEDQYTDQVIFVDNDTTDAPSVTPTPGAAAAIVTNMYLIILSLFVMLK